MPTSLVLRSFGFRPGSLFSGRSMRLGLSRPIFANNSMCAKVGRFTIASTFSKYRADTIVHFTGSKALHATHHDLRESQYSSRRLPSSRQPWIDGIPPPVIFWGILALNVGVFAAWWSAESSYVRSQLLIVKTRSHALSCRE